MGWAKFSGKGRITTTILQEFEAQHFPRLPMLDRIVLNISKVLLFLKVVDVRDGEKVGLLENDDGLIMDWATTKRMCSFFAKQIEWYDEGSLSDQGLVGRETSSWRTLEL